MFQLQFNMFSQEWVLLVEGKRPNTTSNTKNQVVIYILYFCIVHK